MWRAMSGRPWVAAMVRVHGREWCARQAAGALPPFNPWSTFRGITRWIDVVGQCKWKPTKTQLKTPGFSA